MDESPNNGALKWRQLPQAMEDGWKLESLAHGLVSILVELLF
jgi:hypothetical protein